MNSTQAQPSAESQQGTILVILGAGCSFKCRYPLASDMLAQLKEFGDNLGESAARLRNLVLQTVSLFDKLRAEGASAQTLDDVAWLVHQGKIKTKTGTYQDEHDDRLVEDAKVAVAALFLSKERDAVGVGLAGYRNWMRRIFASNLGTNYRLALRNTSYRVVTFNYDRLFELAFRQHFSYDGTEAFYGPTILNSGLYQALPQQVEVNLNQFSFLKLHGSVGMYSYEEHGHCDHLNEVPDPNQFTSITDEEFFVPGNCGVHSKKAKPTLIVFPHEKDLLKEYSNNRFPFRLYIPEVWKAAHHFASQAREIWIVGYSCPEPDFPALRSLIEAAQNCEQIVVQNPFAGDICETLKLRLPNQAHLFKPLKRTFEES